MLKLIIRRWKQLTPGQRATVWLATFVSPLLSLLLYKMQEFLTPGVDGVDAPISAEGLLLTCYAITAGTVTAIAVAARYSQEEA